VDTPEGYFDTPTPVSKTAADSPSGYEEVACRVCSTCEDLPGNLFYLCDGCDETGVHHNCLVQLGLPVPTAEEDWFCSDCEAATSGTDESESEEMATDSYVPSEACLLPTLTLT
jgi:hypothetical protein